MFSLGFVVTMLDKVASIRKTFEPLPLRYKWCGFVSVVLGCAGMSTMNFSRFGEFSDSSRMVC